MIVAGTGILPFMDFLDLLLKIQLFKSLKKGKCDTSVIQPLQDYDGIFSGARFRLMCAFRSLEDFLGWEWIDKLAELSQVDKEEFFECYCKIQETTTFLGIKKVSCQFNTEFLRGKVNASTSKFWICGPPKMQSDVFKELTDLGVNSNQITYV